MKTSLIQLLAVGIGGFAGSITRFLVSRIMNSPLGSIPAGTLTVNLAGSLLLGIIFGYFNQKNPGSEIPSLLFGVGFCGGFTTFSTFALENINLLTSRNPMYAIIYISLSLIGGLALTALGIWIGKLLHS